MEKDNTRQQILDSALNLFSIRGFEASSMSQIAEAVGIRKASLYSHFSSKQEILDCLIEMITSQYNKHSIFSNTNWDEIALDDSEIISSTPAAMAQRTMGQLKYIIHDPNLSRARKMLVIEQFQNPELAKLQTKMNYDDVMNYHVGLFKYLIEKKVIKENDPEILASQFCLPISAWLNLCDREPEKEEYVMNMIEKHVLQFYKMYQN